LIDALPAGVSELAVQPAIDTPELRALTSATAARIGDHHVLTDPRSRVLLDDAEVQLISWSALRAAQRRL
jgi:hypothetical protein